MAIDLVRALGRALPTVVAVVVLTACVSPSLCASGAGDPHFIGFDNQRFDFMGETGNWYDLLSDDTIMVDMFLEYLELAPGVYQTAGTVIRQLRITFLPSHNQLHLYVGGVQFDDVPTIDYNGSEVDYEDPNPVQVQGPEVFFQVVDGQHEQIHVCLGERDPSRYSVFITTPRYSMAFFMVEDGYDEESGRWVTWPHRFLDLVIDVTDESARPGGVLGSTYHGPVEYEPGPNDCIHKRSLVARNMQRQEGASSPSSATGHYRSAGVQPVALE